MIKVFGSIFLLVIALSVVLLVSRYSKDKTNFFSKAVETAACETRAAWINPPAFNTAESESNTIKKLVRMNINTIFLSAYTVSNVNGSNYGNLDDTGGVSKVTLFENVLTDAKKAGMSVFVALDSMRRKYPEGDSQCEKLQCQLDYTDPKEQKAHASWITTWMNLYPGKLSGVIFDNLRYSSDSVASLDPKVRIGGLTATLKASKAAMKAIGPDKSLAAFGGNIDPKPIKSGEYLPPWFVDWQAVHPNDQIYFYHNADGTVKKYRPANLTYDSISWINKGLIDYYAPGNYTYDTKLWKLRTPEWKSFVPKVKFKTLLAGISWLPLQGYISYPNGTTYLEGGNDQTAAMGAVRMISYLRSQGYRGFALFQLGNKIDGIYVDDKPLVDALASGPFLLPVQTCMP